MSLEQQAQHNTELEPEITLEEATYNDIPAYLELEKKVGSKTYSSLKNEKEVIEEMRKGKIYLIREHGKLIGNISYQIADDGSVYLSGFAIDPLRQGNGFGRKALESILDKAKSAPLIELVTHPENYKAINLYKSLGFIASGEKENFFGDGEPRITLVKKNEGNNM